MAYRLQPKISSFMLSLLDEARARTGVARTAMLERLLDSIEQLAQNDLLPRDIGLDFYGAAKVLLSQGQGAKHLDPIMMAGGEHIDVDVSLLERNARSKSQFAGVYATSGGSFRAMVPDFDGNGGTKYLASRPTALRAAIDRYEYFTQHGIPYGNIGRHVEHWRKMRPFASMDEIIQILRGEADNPSYKDPFTSEQLEAWLSRYEAANPPTTTKPKQPPEMPKLEEVTPSLVVQAPSSKPTSRLAAVPDVVVCVLCGEEIASGEAFGPYGKKQTDYGHVSCINDADMQGTNGLG